ncbi:16S rRNA (uracil(1498)-N(3))-methyltransferase [Microbacterium radiodurans]|uniref:Ribosomal RNA small subunit methyltransferase E n=1 Tax=Microbacterium radiodurans TaxID=661398 RepID=A0A5J5IRW2_9MICO|nr:16S rRNA (uracil(1498)-N(3))-methyltransferase [Microbacterium radiodurans]KAA9086781.1 16S rRNA (uracil(1498)-N(3))-methyltransferase [Microbacterium radiodurans]
MALHFLADDAARASAGDEVTLTGTEAHHAAAVRRIRIDEEVTLGDGRGAWLTAVVVSASPREVVVRVLRRADIADDNPRIVLVQALAKGDRDELAVQAATELGVAEIVPWQAARSVSRWDGKEAKGVARWSTIVREAAKQAHRAWVPTVREPVRLDGLVELAGRSRMMLLDPYASTTLGSAPHDPVDARDIVLVVGPEGGIAAEESAALAAAGAESVRLGSTVLRTSTAGAAAIVALNLRLGRW